MGDLKSGRGENIREALFQNDLVRFYSGSHQRRQLPGPDPSPHRAGHA